MNVMNAFTLTRFSPHFMGVSLITMAIEVWGAVIAEIATADVVTTAVGPNILRFVAPLMAAAIEKRDASLAPWR